MTSILERFLITEAARRNAIVDKSRVRGSFENGLVDQHVDLDDRRRSDLNGTATGARGMNYCSPIVV